MSGVTPLRFFTGQFAFNINNFFPLLVLTRRYCLNLNEEQPISVHLEPIPFEHLLACHNKFDS